MTGLRQISRKDELGGKIITKFPARRLKTYAYLIDDDSEAKKAKRIKKCVIKKCLNLLITKNFY